MSLETFFQLAAEITTVVGFLALMFKGLRVLLRRFDKQDDTLARIEHEVFPNTGGSLRDQVDNIRAEQRRQHKRIRSLERRYRDGGDR